jgi:beta-glucosidase-like glycosyl hydrolase
MKYKILFILFLAFSLSANAQKNEDFIPFINSQHEWVDSVFKKLSKREKIAQLFMVRAHSNLGQKYIDSVARVIKKEKLGGIVLFQGGPIRHAVLINEYQKLSKVPLLVALDGEWGLGMRMPDSTISYPFQMTLGAIQNEDLIYQMGQEIATDFKRLGLNINFAPVVDINNNPRNPVINFRSFGENKENVTSKAKAYMKGMMDKGIMISLKHFPGHGDTDVDSHHDLPTLDFSAERLQSLEMYPFKELIKEGASGVMIAHMSIPGLDSTPNLPSSLSKPIVTDILKNELQFKGLTFTDAMDMKGVVKYFKDGEADVRAIIAGNDILEISQNSKRAIKMVQKAIRGKRIDQHEIEKRIKKVLAAKYWLGLEKLQTVDTVNLYKDLHRKSAEILNQTLADNAVTLLINDQPIKALNPLTRTAIISIGTIEISTFQKEMNKKYSNSVNFILSNTASNEDISKLKEELRNFEQLVVALHDSRPRPASVLNYNEPVRSFISTITKESIICYFANPYALATLTGIENAKALLLGYQNDSTLQKAAAKVLLNEIQAKGKLPVTINSFFLYGDGL